MGDKVLLDIFIFPRFMRHNNFTHASLSPGTFFLVTARPTRENAKFHVFMDLVMVVRNSPSGEFTHMSQIKGMELKIVVNIERT